MTINDNLGPQKGKITHQQDRTFLKVKSKTKNSFFIFALQTYKETEKTYIQKKQTDKKDIQTKQT